MAFINVYGSPKRRLESLLNSDEGLPHPADIRAPRPDGTPVTRVQTGFRKGMLGMYKVSSGSISSIKVWNEWTRTGKTPKLRHHPSGLKMTQISKLQYTIWLGQPL